MKNTLIKVLSLVMALAMLTSVFATGTFAVTETASSETQAPSNNEEAECEHEWALEAEVKEPVCGGNPGLTESAEGAIYRVCELCGEKELVKSFGTVVDNAGNEVVCEKCNHNAAYVYDITAAPSCVQDGTADFVCPECGDGYKNIPVAKLGHAYGEWTVVTPAQCGVAGEKQATCTRCGDVASQTIAALRHNYVAVTQGCDCVIEHKDALLDGTYEGANGKSIFALSKEGNCFELGYVLKHCTNCDDLIVDWDDEPTHTWIQEQAKDAAGELVFDDNDNPVMIDKIYADKFPSTAYSCIQYTREYKVCAVCGYEDQIQIVNPEGHKWEDQSKWQQIKGEHACEDYYIRECTVCGATEEGYFGIVAHTMTVYGCPTCDEAGVACTNCTHEGRYKICSVCGGNKTDVAKCEDHTYNNTKKVQISSATCSDLAVYRYTCVNENCVETKDVAEGEKNPNAHGEGWVITGTQAPTCTAAGKQFGMCMNCNYQGENLEYPETEEGKALGHDWVPDSRNTAPTCKVTGYDYGKDCSRCGAHVDGEGEIAIDPTAHPNTTDKTIVGERYATCSVKYGVIVKYEECGCIAVDETTVGDYDVDNHVKNTYESYTGEFVESISLLVSEAAKPADCVTAGSKAYVYCAGCAKVVSENGTALEVEDYKNYSEAYVESMVIGALGHIAPSAATLTTPQVNETCVAPGTTAIYTCGRTLVDGSACTHTEGGETIPKHGKIYCVTYTAKDATCTEAGYVGGKFCSECGVNDGCTYCDNAAKGKNDVTAIIPALGHNKAAHAGYVAYQSCDTEGYTPVKCTRCYAMDQWSVVDYAPATGEHTYPGQEDAEGNFIVDWDTSKEDPTCTEDGYQFAVCTTCKDGTPEVIYNEEYAESEEAKAIGHTYNGSVIALDCQNCEEFIGTACSVCEKVAGTDIEHNYVAAGNAPTCTEAGEAYEVCADCGEKKAEPVEVPALGHTYGYTKEYILATSAADGHWTWVCATCGEEQTIVVPFEQEVTFDIEVTPYIEGVDAADLTIVNGGLVKVTIFATAENITFETLTHKLGYDSTKLSFVSADYLLEFDDVKAEEFAQDNGDNVTAMFFAIDGVATIDGEKVPVISYIFKVAPGVEFLADGFQAAVEGQPAPVEIVYFNNASAEFDVAAIVTLNQINANIDVALMGDVDANGIYDARDVLALRKLVQAGEYNNVADLDNDADIDTADFIALAKFVTSNQTVADYYAMFGVDVDALVADYDYNNYNDDNVINELDAKLFAAAVAPVIAADWKTAVAFGDFSTVLDAVDADLLAD